MQDRETLIKSTNGMTLRILFLGDIVGKIGRHVIQKALPEIKKKHSIDLVIANAENAAHGFGITKKIYDELRALEIDVITLGDHAFDKTESQDLLNQEKPHIIRPANYPSGTPGDGETVIEHGSKKILVINLVGRVFMKMDYDCPFRKADEILAKNKKIKFSAIIVDFHAEASSEKVAMGWYLDGRVSAVLGTHTHIPTADVKILPQGTGHVCDVGMVGAYASVIGFSKENALKNFVTQIPHLLEPAQEGDGIMGAILMDIDPKSMQTVSIRRLDKIIKLD